MAALPYKIANQTRNLKKFSLYVPSATQKIIGGNWRKFKEKCKFLSVFVIIKNTDF